MTTLLKQLYKQLSTLADPARAKNLQRYFKTGPGEYGEGDRFIGLRVPQVRALARQYEQLSMDDVQTLLHSPIHEQRLLALLILVRRFTKTTPQQQKLIYKLTLDNTRYINNWDLVDLSAPTLLGQYLHERDKRPLIRLVRSTSVWERRMAIMATFYFIRKNAFDTALDIAARLLEDEHDLIHKAVGWMLREAGKRDRQRELAFLDAHCHRMPRTMLRYAIEKFPDSLRQRYLRKKR